MKCFCPLNRLSLLFSSFCFVLLIVPTNALAAELDQKEQKLLVELDATTAAKIVQIEKDVEQWRLRLNRIKDQADSTEESDLFVLVSEIIAASEVWPPGLRRHIAAVEKLRSITEEANGLWKSANHDPKSALGQTEAEFRDEVKEFVIAAAEVVLLKTLGDQFFDEFAKLCNPAKYAQQFAENEIAKWLNQPRTIGDLTFKIEKTNPAKSLFAEDAGITIRLTYQQGLSILATGLYFQYRGNRLPEPRFDRLKVDKSTLTDSLANVTLKYLGDSIPSEFGLPIAISNPRFNGFDVSLGKPPASLSFDVTISGFLDFAKTMKLKAEGVTIDTKGHVTVEGGYTFVDQTTRVPIGSTGLVFDGYHITLRPDDREKTATVGTNIAPVSGGKDTITLAVDATFGFPVRKVDFVGKVKAGHITFGNVEGEMSADLLKGKLEFPAGEAVALKEFMEGEFKFVLDRGGLSADGFATLFRATKREFEMFMDFDGNTTLTSHDRRELLGFKVDASVSAFSTPGFRQFELHGVFSTMMNLELFNVDAIIEIDASNRRARNERVIITASAMGESVTIKRPSLDGDITDEIRLALLAKLGDIEQNLRRAIANLEKDVRNTLTIAEEDVRKELARWESNARVRIAERAKRLGTIDTGNARINEELGNLASRLKRERDNIQNLGIGNPFDGDLPNVNLPNSGILPDPGGILPNPANAGSVIEDTVTNPFGTRSLSLTKSTRSITKDERKEESLYDELKLLASAINRKRDSKEKQSQSTRSVFSRRLGEQDSWSAQVDLSFGEAAPVRLGKDDALLPFTIRLCTFRAEMARSRKSPQPTTDVKGASIYFKNIQTDRGRATAQLIIPELRDVSGLSADEFVRDTLHDLIAKYFPDIMIEGDVKRYERVLSVENDTNEAFAVRVKVEIRKLDGRSFRWNWVPSPPGNEGNWHRIVIPAGAKRVFPYGEFEKPLKGARAVLWGGSRSGSRWTKHQSEPIWLVRKNKGGERNYRSDKPGVTTVTIDSDDVSKPRLVEVPNVEGKKLAEAKAELDDLGLDYEEDELFTKKVVGPKSTTHFEVRKQRPSAGKEVGRESSVYLGFVRVVTSPAQKVRVPDVEGKQFSSIDAIAVAFRDEGLIPKPDVLFEREVIGEDPDTVYEVRKQSPGGGKEVDAKSNVELKLVKINTVTKQLINLTNVEGWPLNRAMIELRDSGFSRIESDELFQREVLGNKESVKHIVVEQVPDPKVNPLHDDDVKITLRCVKVVTVLSNEFTMPKLPVDYAEAKSTLADLGLTHTYKIVDQRQRIGKSFSRSLTVARHRPAEGASVRPGDEVQLDLIEVTTVVSKPFRMPLVKQREFSIAKKVIANHGLRLRNVKRIDKPIEIEGTNAGEYWMVTKQTPLAGKSVRKEDPVDIELVKYIVKKRKLVRVPELHRDVDISISRIVAAGLPRPVIRVMGKPVIRYGDYNSETLFVENTSHKPGSSVDPKTTITLYVTKVITRVRETIAVPSVKGFDFNRARVELERKGFGIAIVDEKLQKVSNPQMHNRTEVTAQDPRAGSSKPPRTTVRVWLTRFVFSPRPISAIERVLFVREVMDHRYIGWIKFNRGVNAEAFVYEDRGAAFLTHKLRLKSENGFVTINNEKHYPYRVVSEVRQPRQNAAVREGRLFFYLPVDGDGHIFRSADGGNAVGQSGAYVNTKPPNRSLTTYAIIPEKWRKDLGLFWTCVFSEDGQFVQFKVGRFVGKGKVVGKRPKRINGRVIGQFDVKITTPPDLARASQFVVVPENGNGSGTIVYGEVTVGVTFSTKLPRF